MTVGTISGSKSMPSAGPEALDLMFRLGVLTTEQLRLLLHARISDRRVRTIVAALREGIDGEPLARSVRRSFPFSATAEGRQWTYVHHLTDEGVAFVGARRKLHHRKAASLYSQVLREATVDHALLRNEFYAAFAGELAGGPSDGPSPVAIETMLAEGGMTPMEVTPRKEGSRSWLNPDGLMELASDDDPTFHEAFFIESDTGSEDMPWQVRSHAEKYAEHFVTMLRAGGRAPRVLFVSPNTKRSRWVRQVLYALGQEKGTRFYEARATFNAQGLSFPERFVFTNLEWLRTFGPLGRSYWSLNTNDLAPPF